MFWWKYLWRHNSILVYLYNILKETNSTSEVYIDLPQKHLGITTIPTDIVITNQKPDLVIVNRESKEIVLFELSVPFEINISNTHQRKIDRYKNLISDIEESGYNVHYFAIEIGSRAYIDNDNISRLKTFSRKYLPGKKFLISNHQFVKLRWFPHILCITQSMKKSG